MAKSKILKTKPDLNTAALETFLAAVPDDAARNECADLAAMMYLAEGSEPKLWSGKMLGFGDYHYRYASGHEGDTFVVGFAYRKTGFSIYLGCSAQAAVDLLKQLGKHKMGVGCLYVRRLADVDQGVLKKLIVFSVKETRRLAAEMQAATKPEAKATMKPTATAKPKSKPTKAAKKPVKKAKSK